MGGKYIKVTAQGVVAVMEGEGEKPDLDFLQSHVRGDIELVAMPELSSKGVDMFVNEEGKLLGFPLNHTATWLSGLFPYDVVVGDAVIVGEDRETGDSLWLTDEQTSAVLAVAMGKAGVAA